MTNSDVAAKENTRFPFRRSPEKVRSTRWSRGYLTSGKADSMGALVVIALELGTLSL